MPYYHLYILFYVNIMISFGWKKIEFKIENSLLLLQSNKHESKKSLENYNVFCIVPENFQS